MKTLKQYINEAQSKKIAIGHFNISNLEGFWAVVNAGKAISEKAGRPVPVIIGVSEGERDFVGVEQIRALVDTVQDDSHPVFLNADHTYSFDKVKEVVDAGYDAAIFDGNGNDLSFEDNVTTTKKCVEYAKAKSKELGKEILVEGELGFIGKSSKILDAIPTGVGLDEASLTKPDQAKAFVSATGIDLLAPAVGNIHGMLRSGVDPALNITRIGEIAQAAGVPLVLHGGSGTSDSDFVKAIDAGIAIIHINTELRLAYRDGLKLSLQENTEEIAPYKYLKPALHAMQAAVEKKLVVFNKL